MKNEWSANKHHPFHHGCCCWCILLPLQKMFAIKFHFSSPLPKFPQLRNFMNGATKSHQNQWAMKEIKVNKNIWCTICIWIYMLALFFCSSLGSSGVLGKESKQLCLLHCSSSDDYSGLSRTHRSKFALVLLLFPYTLLQLSRPIPNIYTIDSSPFI